MNDALLQASLSADRKSVVIDPILFNAGASRIGLQVTVRTPVTADGVWLARPSGGRLAYGGGGRRGWLVGKGLGGGGGILLSRGSA